ncbi:MAG: fibronectin type III domain-containing protein [Planctomycetota bacterium]
MKNRAYWMIAVLFLVAFVTTFNYGGCNIPSSGGGGSSGSSGGNTGGIPNAPSNLVATAISSTVIELTWSDNSNNEDGFLIYEKIGASGEYSIPGDLDEINVELCDMESLTASTTYYFKLRAYNAQGQSSYSNEASATTAGVTPPVTSQPSATTLPAGDITLDSATFNGLVNPNGLSTSASFQWGTSAGYGNLTPSQSIGNGNSNLNVFASLSGLTSGTTYYFRLRASNSKGTTYSSGLSFTTLQRIP